jgi:galactokinase
LLNKVYGTLFTRGDNNSENISMNLQKAVIASEDGTFLTHNGFDFLAMSNLPSGVGLSSSAAIELASALAFLEMAGVRPPLETVVKIGRHAENHFVGVPCGILDQGVSGFGQKNKLVWIDCRGPLFATVPLPAAAHFWIFNTHTKHALVDGLYAARHRECMTAAAAAMAAAVAG